MNVKQLISWLFVLPCSELKMENRYMKARLTGPQANRAKPHVIPSRKVRLTTLRRFRRTWNRTEPNRTEPNSECVLRYL